MKNIAILASGSGTNADNIARTFAEGNRIRVAVCLTNRRDAGVRARMEALGIDCLHIPNSVWDNDPRQVVDTLRRYGTDLVVLAGFMHYVSPVILDAYPGRVVNIHPSLLPAYGGKGMWGHHVHQAVIAAGERQSGVTVHYVTEEFDKGEIVMQQSLDIRPGTTPEQLEQSIHAIEYDLYPRAIVAALGRDLPPASADRRDAGHAEQPDTATAVAQTADTETADAQTPPVPDAEWAEVLGVPYDPAAVPPPVPQTAQTPPATPGSTAPAAPASPAANAYYRQPAQAGDDGAMPPTYVAWAVIMTVFCCFIPGVIAIVCSSQVSSRYLAGDIAGAWRASRNTEIWCIVSFVLGLLTASFYLPLMML